MKHLLGAFLLSLPLLGNAAELNLPLLPDGAAANIAKKAPPELAAPLNAAIELGVHLVAAPEMTLLNETFLHHTGSTDVITFNHAEENSTDSIHGEIFICLDDAVKQADAFRTTWQSELARYVIHGVLHLRGFDDLTPSKRRVMKREENRLLRESIEQFPLPRFAKLVRRKTSTARHR